MEFSKLEFDGVVGLFFKYNITFKVWEPPWMLCWSIALCFRRGESLVQKQKKCLVHCAAADLAQIWWYQHKVVQPQALKTWGFPGLAASQQSSLMHETEQVTYSEHCMGLFLMHTLGTKNRYVRWKHSICTLLFYVFLGVVCGGYWEG